MRIPLRHLWETISSGYWFIPGAMTVFAAGLAIGILAVDRHVIGSAERLGWLYGGGADGAKTLLSTVAGSIITVAGVVFSITIASLTQASAQFGPRLLRNFMRDTSNQVVLGTFVATFVYCLLVLRTIHGKLSDGRAFVPQASVTVAVLLAVADVAVLIFFIHHVSVSLQAPNVVAAVLSDLSNVIDSVSRDQIGVAEPVYHEIASLLPTDFESRARTLHSASDGYVQAVDYDSLIATAVEEDLILRVTHRAGDHVIARNPLLCVYPAESCKPQLDARLTRALICGSQRTPEQDVEYAVRQMVEVAVRALSPGINDPFTAINCLDSLGSAVCRLARIGLPGPLRYDARGNLRLVTPVTTFAGIADAAFNQIRQYGRGSVSVTLRLLEVIAACAPQVTDPRQRQILLQHAEMTFRQSDDAAVVPERRDREDIADRWQAVTRAFTATVPRDCSGGE